MQRVSRLYQMNLVVNRNLSKCTTHRTICTNHKNTKYSQNKPVSYGCASRKEWQTVFNSGISHGPLVFRHHKCYSSLPDHTVVGLPNLSPTMETGTIKAWLKSEGDKVEEGDAIVEIETDKSVMVADSSYSGYIARILIPEGTKDIPIGKPMYILVEEQGDVSALKDFNPEEDSSPVSTPEPEPQSSPPASAFTADLPDHTVVGLPALSPTMVTGAVAEWHKKEGDKIEEGEDLAVIETDKASVTMEASDSGFIARIFLPEGTKDIPIGQPMFLLVNDASDVEAFRNFTPADPSAPLPSPPVTPPGPSTPSSAPTATAPSTPATKPEGGRVFASPLAKQLAKQRGIDLSTLAGSGPGGRIVAEDVPMEPSAAPAVVTSSASAPQGSTTSAYTDIDLTSMRKTIAKRLTESKQSIPHYYLTVDVEMGEIESLRKELNGSLSKNNVKLSVNDFVIKASALACKKVPSVNSAWMETFIREFKNVDVCVAVATPNGLITPIVSQAETKGLATINTEVIDLASRAREGRLQPHEFQGGTFTISNLGMFGVKSFTAIINPPQACILAVGATSDRILVDESLEEGYRPARVMSVTLSCDHRVVDGAVGAQWLAEFRKLMETPHLMLL